MAAKKVQLAIDCGTESGRGIAGIGNGKRIRLGEVHGFSNVVVQIGNSLRRDVVRLWREIQTGLTQGVPVGEACLAEVRTREHGVLSRRS